MSEELQLGKYEFYPYEADEKEKKSFLDEILEKSYKEMSEDEEAEAEAVEWCEGTIGDIGDDEW